MAERKPGNIPGIFFNGLAASFPIHGRRKKVYFLRRVWYSRGQKSVDGCRSD
jgi:hypothetical protein